MELRHTSLDELGRLHDQVRLVALSAGLTGIGLDLATCAALTAILAAIEEQRGHETKARSRLTVVK
jgi:hypothetical protein